MIHVVYCPDVGPDHAGKVVVAAGNCCVPSGHYHASDGLDHTCLCVDPVPEGIPTGYPWLCGDLVTWVATPNAWLVYLEVYIP